jgi:hypothetical protein
MEKNKIPTAEEFLKDRGLYNDKSVRLQHIGLTVSEAMIEFAKLHVQAQTKEFLRYLSETDLENGWNKDSIINAYPLTNIK